MPTSAETRIGLIGLGYWGPNYLRVFSQLPNSRIVACAEKKPSNMAFARRLYPAVTLYGDYQQLLNDPEIDAVVIATPSSLHFEMTRNALRAGKHVLVEKPLTLATRDAETLHHLARAKHRVLLVGHTFLFNAGVRTLKKILHSGELGHIHYLRAVRTNLGPIRQDVNALVDLAPHDISIFLDLLGHLPKSVSAQGAAYVKKGREDVALINLFFPNNVLGTIHVSWLEPSKMRRITVIGSRKMAIFNDVSAADTLRIYDKGVVKSKRYSDFGEFQLVIRDGDVTIPKVPPSEPLKNQCQHFLEAIQRHVPVVSDGAFGVRVVKVMETALHSLHAGGKTLPLDS